MKQKSVCEIRSPAEKLQDRPLMQKSDLHKDRGNNGSRQLRPGLSGNSTAVMVIRLTVA